MDEKDIPPKAEIDVAAQEFVLALAAAFRHRDSYGAEKEYEWGRYVARRDAFLRRVAGWLVTTKNKASRLGAREVDPKKCRHRAPLWFGHYRWCRRCGAFSQGGEWRYPTGGEDDE